MGVEEATEKKLLAVPRTDVRGGSQEKTAILTVSDKLDRANLSIETGV